MLPDREWRMQVLTNAKEVTHLFSTVAAQRGFLGSLLFEEIRSNILIHI